MPSLYCHDCVACPKIMRRWPDKVADERGGGGGVRLIFPELWQNYHSVVRVLSSSTYMTDLKQNWMMKPTDKRTYNQRINIDSRIVISTMAIKNIF